MLRARFIPFPFRFNGFPSARPCSSSCAVRGRFTAAPASASRCVRRLTGLRTFAVANRYHRPLCHIGSMSKSAFHTSARRGDAPVLVLSFLFKTSYALTAATSITRVALTLLPLVLLQRLAITRFLRVPDPCATLAKRICDCLATASRRRFYLMKHRQLTRMAWALVFVPAVSLGLTLCASVETTPLTGRKRLIMLSPHEEENLAHSLTGERWHTAVRDILTSSSTDSVAPTIIPTSDWRYIWAETTLRQLEASVLSLASQSRSNYESDYPVPPPRYPLLPRPACSAAQHPQPHCIRRHDPFLFGEQLACNFVGPPYSLLIVDQPEANAFSYGMNHRNAGGIVLNSGFISQIIGPSAPPASPVPTTTYNTRHPSRTPPAAPPSPTPQQTAALATLLAHELSHLILSHHLEALSSNSVLFPSVSKLIGDSTKAILFPLLLLAGPFVKDKLSEVGMERLSEVQNLASAHASRKLEIEADIVSLRILANAGFDPRFAIQFWECQLASESTITDDDSLRRRRTHPVTDERIRAMRAELDSWQRHQRTYHREL